MVKLVKKEWHQVTREFEFEFTEDLLREIYDDLDDDEISELMQQIENGLVDIEEIVNDAGVDFDWEFTYDDWWTDRKGGYDITFEVANGTE